VHALGVVLRDEGRAAEALPFLARAFEIRLRELKKGDRDRVEVTRDYDTWSAANQGESLGRDKRYDSSGSETPQCRPTDSSDRRPVSTAMQSADGTGFVVSRGLSLTLALSPWPPTGAGRG
jgi:hypothetical protein